MFSFWDIGAGILTASLSLTHTHVHTHTHAHTEHACMGACIHKYLHAYMQVHLHVCVDITVVDILSASRFQLGRFEHNTQCAVQTWCHKVRVLRFLRMVRILRLAQLGGYWRRHSHSTP